MSITWTHDQLAAIETVGLEVAVNAAAGSGKTAALAERFVRLVRGGCAADAVLVVTFTRAAAAEMRQRIRTRLHAVADDLHAAGDPDAGHVATEAGRLTYASIDTLDAFCAKLVRRYVARADVDPGFAVLDADQAAVVRRQAARGAVDAALSDDPAAADLADVVFDGNVPQIVETLVGLHATLASLAEPRALLDKTLADLAELDAEADFDATRMSRMLGMAVAPAASRLAAACVNVRKALAAAESAADAAGVERLAAEITAYVASADEVVRHYHNADYAAAREAFSGIARPNVRLGRSGPTRTALVDARKTLTEALYDAQLGMLLADLQDTRRAARSAAGPTRALLELHAAFDARYKAAKTRLRSLDFADIGLRARSLLGEDDIRDEVRRRYAHVLVDESQDLNALQADVVARVSRPADDPRGGNLFSVGDVKQSIYGFRHADPRDFVRRLRETAASPRGRRIDMRANFRARSPLLHAVNDVMGRLMTGEEYAGVDYRDNHALVQGRDDPEADGFTGGPVEILIIPKAKPADDDSPLRSGEAPGDGEVSTDDEDLEDSEREAHVVADTLITWRNAGRRIHDRSSLVGLQWRHVAVLMRSPKFAARRFVATLRQRGIPCVTEAGTGYFEAHEVLDVVSVLRMLEGRRGDVDLAAYLRSPLAGLPDDVDAAELLARCRLAAPAARTFADAVGAAAASEGEPHVPPLRAALARLEAWSLFAASRSAADTVWHILTSSGYLAYVVGLRDGLQREANLLDLHRRAADFDAGRRGNGVGAFADDLDDLADAADSPQAPTDAGGDAVRLMSVHAAKGLEFPVVFLCGCGKTHNMVSARGRVLVHRDFGVALPAVDREKRIRYASPQTASASAMLQSDTLAEELRVLYVAMTRAREHLTCIGHARIDVDAQMPKAIATLDAMADAEGRLLNADVFLARSFLEWLLFAAGRGSGHLVAEVVPRPQAHETEDTSKPPLAVLDRLPLTPGPVVDAQTADLVRRLTQPYRYADETARPAAVPLHTGRRADSPWAFVLSHINWRTAATDAAHQVAALATRGLLPADEASAADLVAWLISTPPLRAVAAGGRTRFDVRLYVAGEGEGDDRPMLRGRAAMVHEPVDFKSPLVVVDLVPGGVTQTPVGDAARLGWAVGRACGREAVVWHVDVSARLCVAAAGGAA